MNFDSFASSPTPDFIPNLGQPQMSSGNPLQFPNDSFQQLPPTQSTSVPFLQPVQPVVRGRLRVSKACDRCRSQKIKCSGTAPCNTCLKHSKECKYSETPIPAIPSTQKHNGTKKLKTSSPEPTNTLTQPQSFTLPPLAAPDRFSLLAKPLPILSTAEENHGRYISHLESRVHYLESLLLSNSRNVLKEPDNGEVDYDDVVTILDLPGTKWRYSRRHQNGLIVELCRAMYSSLSKESQQLVVVPRPQFFGWNMSGVHYLTSERLPDAPEIQLPREKEFYIDYFFKEINPVFGILHELAFREQVIVYDKIISEENDRLRNLRTSGGNSSKIRRESRTRTNQTKLFTALLNLIFTLSIRFTEFAKKEGPVIKTLKLEETLMKYSYKVVSVLSFEWESFELIQCWLLMALYLRVSHRQTSSFNALGTAITMTRSMGLSHEHTMVTHSTPYQRRKAKRIFWSVFLMDRLFGLQSGRYLGVPDTDIDREFPSWEFRKESAKDDWITLPSFIMIHMARVANLIHTAKTDHFELVKIQQFNQEITRLNNWFNENGFNDDDDIFPENEQEGAISSVVKMQTKMFFYDLILCVHGRGLYNFVGRKISQQGMKLEMVVEASQGIIKLMNKLNGKGLIYLPWPLNLLLTYNVGINALTLISGGAYVKEAKILIASSINLMTIIKRSPVLNTEGRTIMKERFTMAKECLWALKMTNHMLSLKLKESYEELTNIGIDHGSSEVNEQTFSQIGYVKDRPDDKLLKLFDLQDAGSNKKSNKNRKRKIQESSNDSEIVENHPGVDESEGFRQEMSPASIVPEVKNLLGQDRFNILETENNETTTSDNSPASNSSASLYKPIDDNMSDLYGSLQWFDQWLDYNHDMN